MENFDLVVIGAGMHGLSAAKTYKEVNPHATILILDKHSTIGGVWSDEQRYFGLKTNNHFGSLEYSDMAMKPYGYDAEGHIPGHVVYDYIAKYADEHHLTPFVRFRCEVRSAKDLEGKGWMLEVEDALSLNPAEPHLIHASKLIVGVGLFCEPHMPRFEGLGDFGAPVIHSSEFGKHGQDLKLFENVVIYGGAKFSWDVAAAFASHGVEVDWVIRSSGHGPMRMVPSFISPFKFKPERLLNTRMVTWFSPCIWGSADGYGFVRWLLHCTFLGQLVVQLLFWLASSSANATNGYDLHPETKKLKPRTKLIWGGTNGGVLNHDVDVLELVRQGKIRVHIADIERLSLKKIHLANGTTLDADIMICGSGWKPSPPMNFVTRRDLSLPRPATAAPASTVRANQELITQLPSLKQQPYVRADETPSNSEKTTLVNEPYRLYRFIVPPSCIQDRTLAFVGAVRIPFRTPVAEVQSLWIAAFFAGKLKHLQGDAAKVDEKVRYDAVLHSEFNRLRYPHGLGAFLPDIWLDSLPYVDLMLQELGVKRHRKSSAWREALEPYEPSDYAGIVEEWRALHQPDVVA